MSIDTERKDLWVDIGRGKEDDFVEFMSKMRPDLNVYINPEKENNPYVPDLIINGQVCDLKTQETPFFKAELLYGKEPQYAVTFNVKDFQRYQRLYANIIVVFWINWKVTEMAIRGIVYTVSPMNSVWACSLSKIKEFVRKDVTPHDYQRRINDDVNAKNSYVLDARDMKKIV